MRARVGWWVLSASILALAVYVLWACSKEQPPIRLKQGRELRILKISFGTNHVLSAEPLWKQALRRALPDALERPLGRAREFRRRTPCDSLALYFHLHSPINTNQRWLLRPEVLFPDGSIYPRELRMYWGPVSGQPLVLENYPRGEQKFTLRLWDGDQSVDIEIRNPHRSRRAPWVPRPFPQTNDAGATQIILRGWRDSTAGLIEQCAGARAAGWMRWRTTLFDPWGNWECHETGRSPRFPGASSETVYRLVAEPTEYISAGFVEHPRGEQYEILSHNARTNWGVRLLVLLGPGAYEISTNMAVQNRKAPPVATNTLEVTRSGWVVRCAQPALLSISDRAVEEVRLRERFPENEGRIFAGRKTGSATQHAIQAQLFTPRLPTLTTNLEAEVIIRWPTAEFFIEKPQERGRQR